MAVIQFSKMYEWICPHVADMARSGNKTYTATQSADYMLSTEYLGQLSWCLNSI
jgi:hypothetical protein